MRWRMPFMKPLLSGLLWLSAGLAPLGAAEPAADRAPAVGFSASEVREQLRLGKRFFDGGGFRQAAAVYEQLLADPGFGPLPPLAQPTQAAGSADWNEYRQRLNLREERQTQREAVKYFLARCHFEEAGQDLDRLLHTRDELLWLGENRDHFSHPAYTQEALFWAGRAQLQRETLAAAQDRTLTDPVTSAMLFQRLLNVEAPVEIESEASRHLASALLTEAQNLAGMDEAGWQNYLKRQNPPLPAAAAGPAEGGEWLAAREARRRELLLEAKKYLERVAVLTPNQPHRREVELGVIEILFALRDYPETLRLAAGFLERETTPDTLRAKVCLFSAQCRFQQGEFDSARGEFEALLAKEQPDPETRLSALCGLGWTCRQLARTAGPERQTLYLNQAKLALTRALGDGNNLVSPTRRARIIYNLGEIRLDLGEFAEVRSELQELLDDPRLGVKAHFLSGQAARRQGDYGAALAHFEQVFQLAQGQEGLAFSLETLLSLAELEQERGECALALIYCRRAVEVASLLSDLASLTKAQVGAAEALIGLGAPDQTRETTAAREAAESLARLGFAASTGRQLAAAADRAESRLQAWRLWRGPQAPDYLGGNYDRALETLNLLRQRYSERVPLDLLDYLEGETRFLKAEVLSRHALELPGEKLQLAPVYELFDQAGAALRRAEAANSRGQLAPRISCLLGRVFRQRGLLSLAQAERLRRHEFREEAQAAAAEGNKNLDWSQTPFQQAVRMAGSDWRLRADSLRELGESNFELGRYDEAAQSFSELARDPAIKSEERLAATRRLAECLAREGNPAEAEKKLRPFAAVDPASAVLRGNLLLELDRPGDAYRAYRSGLSGGGADSPWTSELRYRAGRLVLTQAEAASAGFDPAALRDQAVQDLQRLIVDRPQSAWACRAALALGDYFLAGKQDAALAALVGKLIAADPQIPPPLRQTGLLVQGRQLAARGDYVAAEAAFAQAVGIRQNENDVLLRRQAAEAELERGLAAGQLKQADKALTCLNRVFAAYPDEPEVADRARLAAAELRARENRYDLAFAILEGGSDRQAMLDKKIELEKRQAAAGEK